MPSLQRSGKWTHSLSLCMIVKNESETLDKCLRLARDFVDEIVVVDTGSTDGSQEIAQRYADVFEEIEWPNSFAKARNYSFDLASGDFILWLDGDEYLPKTTDWRRLRKALNDDVAFIELSIVNLLGENSLLESDRFSVERVVRNDPAIRFEGSVHNQIISTLDGYMKRTGTRGLTLDIDVIHTGYSYSVERMKEKYQPRLELLQTEYKGAQSVKLRAYYGFQLGVAYSILQEPDEALDVLNQIDYRVLTPANAFYAHLLASKAAIQLDDPSVALLHCNKMFDLTRTEPTAYFLTGIAFLKGRRPHDGMLMILEAYDVNAVAGKDVRFAINARHLVKRLAELCGQIGLRRQADMLKKIIRTDAYDEEIMERLIIALKAGFAKSAPEVA